MIQHLIAARLHHSLLIVKSRINQIVQKIKCIVGRHPNIETTNPTKITTNDNSRHYPPPAVRAVPLRRSIVAVRLPLFQCWLVDWVDADADENGLSIFEMMARPREWDGGFYSYRYGGGTCLYLTINNPRKDFYNPLCSRSKGSPLYLLH